MPQMPRAALVAYLFQRRAFVHRDVVGLVALDLILRIIVAGVTRMAFVVNIPGVHLDGPAADIAGFRVPDHVIADLEFLRHGRGPRSRQAPSAPAPGAIWRRSCA